MRLRIAPARGLLLAAVAAAFGCTSDLPPAGSGNEGNGGSGGEAPQVTGKELFAEIEEELVGTCGGCHQEGGAADAPFLAKPDRYVSITAWPGIIVENPGQSILVTHPALPTHGGGEAPDLPEALKPKVIQWLEREAAERPETSATIGPQLTPFRPLPMDAFNTVYLGSLGPEFEYMSISFYATELGGTLEEPTMLYLYNITVHTVTGAPLHIVHPLFTVYAPSEPPDPDPVDSFSNVDQTFTIDTDPTLGTGQLVLTNWTKGAYLGLAFELIEVYGGTPGTGSGCVDITSFHDNVVPAMQYCKDNCHGGTNPQAKNTMDLSGLNAATPTDACVQVRARITPGDPDTSPILIVTNPQEPVYHMYKFSGNVNKYNSFKDNVSPWIVSEGQ